MYDTRLVKTGDIVEISQPWGAEFICLQLPMCRVSIQGLSPGQRQTILHNFPSYVLRPGETAGGSDWICRAGRLNQPVGLPPERFAASGQYAPLKRRTSGGIEITGLDFRAHLVRGGSPPFQATLAVAREEELGRAFVLENFLRIVLAYHALSRGGVLLHSAGVVQEGAAFLFSGRSYAGKSTLARKAAAAGALVLSDDINLVFRDNDGYLVHRVPFTGEFRRPGESLSGSETYRLGRIALLEKAQALTAAPVDPAAGVAGLLTGCPYVNDDPEEMPVLLDILTKIAGHAPVVRLGVARDDSFQAIMATLLRCSENA
jgi:hypothetical protein